MADYESLLEARSYKAIARLLIDAIKRDKGYDIEELRLDPGTELARVGIPRVEVRPLPEQDCPVAGYFDHRTEVIVLHPSWTEARDRFTLLHELGHYVQRVTPAWADAWCLLPTAEGNRVNERVADEFAGQLLIPDNAVDLKAGSTTAQQLATEHKRLSTASRSALAYRSLEGAGIGDDVAVAVCDLDGLVIYARATGRLWAPPTQIAQPGFAGLIAHASQAASGLASGILDPGLVSRSGNIQDGLVADVALDHERRYAFVVVRLAHRYAQPLWVDRTTECPNPACGEAFVPETTMSKCPVCNSHHCPSCGSCDCISDASPSCPDCNIAYSATDRLNPADHECW
ncbi:ImmA/IrrE family metallo-endopeptidase [Litorihabitans aurantiacus]|uniref:ImmA/IrrE family metallo-endopeptidase n=1 Tax=Litorihabitans aurantiacus TaxID=1930061 RepID=UPI003D6724FC